MTSQLRLDTFPKSRTPSPTQKLVLSYGGGVNSVAVLVWLSRNGFVPTAIVMADPGSEWGATEVYRDEILPQWLDAVGYPRVTVINRRHEGKYREKAWRLETLREECVRLRALPSVAYGWKKCSQKYKGETQRWWIARQPWAQEAWLTGKIVKVIGYDADEGARVHAAFQNGWEAARFEPWYPLHEAGLTREDCEELIRSVGLPVPQKSACTFCPNNTLEEWQRLRVEEPSRFEEAVTMSRNAMEAIESPEVVGLMRCSPRGRRQLHEWADGLYDDEEAARCTAENPMPCECSL